MLFYYITDYTFMEKKMLLKLTCNNNSLKLNYIIYFFLNINVFLI